jgi:hypothetical protein
MFETVCVSALLKYRPTPTMKTQLSFARSVRLSRCTAIPDRMRPEEATVKTLCAVAPYLSERFYHLSIELAYKGDDGWQKASVIRLLRSPAFISLQGRVTSLTLWSSLGSHPRWPTGLSVGSLFSAFPLSKSFTGFGMGLRGKPLPPLILINLSSLCWIQSSILEISDSLACQPIAGMLRSLDIDLSRNVEDQWRTLAVLLSKLIVLEDVCVILVSLKHDDDDDDDDDGDEKEEVRKIDPSKPLPAKYTYSRVADL